MSADDATDSWDSALPAPAPSLRCVVVVPARDEAALLPAALNALVGQQSAACAYEVIVLANNCQDGTAACARQWAARQDACTIHVLEVHWPPSRANVGTARGALMNLAQRRLREAGAADGILLSTDADTRVAADWLAANVAAIDAGADAVGGRILTDDDELLPTETRRLKRLDEDYRLCRSAVASWVDPDPNDPWPRHHQHFGASLAVRATAYAAVGGLPAVPFMEDEALVQALRLHDRSVRHSLSAKVHTSARLDGRAEVGLSWQLREWVKAGGQGLCPYVPDPRDEVRRWHLRRVLRSAWRQRRDSSARPDHASNARASRMLQDMGVDPQVAPPLEESGFTFGQLWRTMQAHLPPPSLVRMDDALERLHHLAHATGARTNDDQAPAAARTTDRVAGNGESDAG